MSYKVLFCGTPEFAKQQLEALLLDPDYQVVTVVSQPDRPAGRGHKLQPSPVKELATQHHIPVLTPEKASDPEFIAELSQHSYDVCIVVAYGQILRKNFLDLFPQKCVNVHASLLPRWRGAAPIQRAIMSGDTETGVCLQVVVPQLDAGAVIGERRLQLSLEADARTVHDALARQSVELLQVDLKKYLQGNMTPHTQDEQLVTYAHKIDKAESVIDWTRPALEIHNKVRGLALGPQASTFFQGKRLKILKTKMIEEVDTSHSSGHVFVTESGALNVVCGSGQVLEVLIVQPESKKPMTVGDFLRGYDIQKGGMFAAH